MIQKYYTQDNLSTQNEAIVREFLLHKADTIRLTSVVRTELRWFKIIKRGGQQDPQFVKTLNRLHQDFQRKVTNNKRFDDIRPGKKAIFTHYFYRLSVNLKKKLNQETLFWLLFPPTSKNFYGFEDPTFYHKNKMIGGVISDERYFFLYLTEAEKKRLEAQGVKMHSLQ